MSITARHSINDIIKKFPESGSKKKKKGIDQENPEIKEYVDLPLEVSFEQLKKRCNIAEVDNLLNDLNSGIKKLFEQSTIGELVAENPLRARVFDQYGLDFCCGGKQTIEAACRNKRTSVPDVVSKLLELSESTGIGDSWKDASLEDLLDNILTKHHEYLNQELPRLDKLAEKVARVHGEKEPRMIELASVFQNLKQELEQHTMKEETVLFPYIRELEREEISSSPRFGTVANPIRCMEFEHEEAGQALEKMRALTDGYTPPADACGSWRALLAGLIALDEDLRTHIHKENSILFPKALKLENAKITA